MSSGVLLYPALISKADKDDKDTSGSKSGLVFLNLSTGGASHTRFGFKTPFRENCVCRKS